MGIVATSAHQSGNKKSASSPRTVKAIQKTLRSIPWIVAINVTSREVPPGTGL
jgi:hypothetical protein